jgi:hypothetical protein
MQLSINVFRTVASLAVLLAFSALGYCVSAQDPTWRLASDEDVTHRRASRLCERLEAGGRSDWRLPTPDEIDRLAARAEGGDEEAAATVAALGDAAAWTRDDSDSGLAWAGAFAHGFQLRIHQGNERWLRALCVAGPEPGAPAAGAPGFDDLAEGPWQRPLDVETDSPLLWGCAGEESGPVILKGSIGKFNRLVPPGPLREVVPVDFVIDAEGRPRWAGPAPGSSERLGGLAVDTLETITYAAATCDGEAVPVFFHLDFGQTERRVRSALRECRQLGEVAF